jgi:hypothetical protein
MMKARLSGCALVPLLAFFLGCSSVWPVHPDPRLMDSLKGRRVGVVLLAIPPGGITEGAAPSRTLTPPSPDAVMMEGPWMDDAEYRPLRLAEMKPLQEAVVEGGPGGFSQVQDMFVEGLRRRGAKSFKVCGPVTARGLPAFKTGLGKRRYPAVDYRYLARRCGADCLMVIELADFGPYCHYIHATNDYTEVRAEAETSLIDASTNSILWKTARGRGRFRREVAASCGNEEQIPVIMRALDELLYHAADGLYLDFFSPP